MSALQKLDVCWNQGTVADPCAAMKERNNGVREILCDINKYTLVFGGKTLLKTGSKFGQKRQKTQGCPGSWTADGEVGHRLRNIKGIGRIFRKMSSGLSNLREKECIMSGGD